MKNLAYLFLSWGCHSVSFHVCFMCFLGLCNVFCSVPLLFACAPHSLIFFPLQLSCICLISPAPSPVFLPGLLSLQTCAAAQCSEQLLLCSHFSTLYPQLCFPTSVHLSLYICCVFQFLMSCHVSLVPPCILTKFHPRICLPAASCIWFPLLCSPLNVKPMGHLEIPAT